jgi:hypothetical protein
MMRTLRKIRREAVAVCTLALALGGCSISSILLPSTSAKAPVITAKGEPVPRVQDCLLVTVSYETPAKYVCHGKTYTSRELVQLREGGASAAVASK